MVNAAVIRRLIKKMGISANPASMYSKDARNVMIKKIDVQNVNHFSN